MGLKCPFELELVKSRQNPNQLPCVQYNLEEQGRAAAVFTQRLRHMFMPVFPLLPVGGPHLFSACAFVLLLKCITHWFPSNEKYFVASKLWAHFISQRICQSKSEK